MDVRAGRHEPSREPYDNASCESFMKRLKREEIYANRYNNLEQLRTNIEEFTGEYYNRQRLHSALGYPISRGIRTTKRAGTLGRLSGCNRAVYCERWER